MYFKRKFQDTNPPKGSFYKRDRNTIRVGFNYSNSLLYFLIPFTIFWTSISMGSFIIMGILSSKFELIRTLFYLPFFLFSLILVYVVLNMSFGKFELILNSSGGQIKKGFFLRQKRISFNWSDVSLNDDILVKNTNLNLNPYLIFIKDQELIELSLAMSEKKEYVLQVFLEHLHRQGKQNH